MPLLSLFFHPSSHRPDAAYDAVYSLGTVLNFAETAFEEDAMLASINNLIESMAVFNGIPYIAQGYIDLLFEHYGIGAAWQEHLSPTT